MASSTSKAFQVVQVRNPKSMAFVLMFAAFIGLFSETALNMALTNIMSDFNVSASTAQWLTTGYLLTIGILVPVSSLLIQWFSTKQLVVGSLIFSILGTILAALAPNFSILLIGRIIQALGTGIILPLMMNIILLIFPIHKRGAVMGLMGLVITTAPAIGPAIAGLIVDSFDWPYIFWISLLFYAALIIIGLKQIDNVSKITKPTIDMISIILSTLGFGGLIYSLSVFSEKSLYAPEVYVPFIIGIVSILLFCNRQFKMKQPMMNLRVFKYPIFTIGTLLVFSGMLLILSSAILLPMFLKGTLLFTATVAGIILLPGSAMNAICSPVVGRLFDRFGAKKFLPTGFLLTFVSSLFFIFTISVDTPIWQVILSHAIFFIGISMIIMPSQTTALNQLPRNLYSDGAAVISTLQQIAGGIGTALAITFMVSGQNGYLEKVPKATSHELIAEGTKYAYNFIIAISVVGLILSFFMVRFINRVQLEKDK